MYTDLTYINHSYDSHLPSIVIVQKNQADSDNVMGMAWLVIKQCRYNWRHPFRFPWGLSVEIVTGEGHSVLEEWIEYGGIVSVRGTTSGHYTLVLTKTADPMNILVNNESENNISVNVYRGARLLAMRQNLVSGQSVRFHFDYSILCGTALKVESGQSIDLKRIMSINQPIDIFGLHRGRIILTGGGPGPFIKPLQFHLMKDEYW